jgi:hypothetical protein
VEQTVELLLKLDYIQEELGEKTDHKSVLH